MVCEDRNKSVEILSPEELFVEILQEERPQSVSAGRDTRRLCGLAGLHGGGEVGKGNIRSIEIISPTLDSTTETVLLSDSTTVHDGID